jgi:poly[(R)-3-hydroxyalkanoate] polymerase subunit PhaE
MSNKRQKKNDGVDWSEFQKKYFDVLRLFNSPASFVDNPSENSFWSEAMGHWWKSMKADSNFGNETLGNKALFEKIVSQCRHYYFMGEQFSSLMEGMTNLKNKDASSFINKKFKEFESMFPQTSDFSWSSFIDAGELPYDLFKKSTPNNALDFSDLFENFSPEIKKMRDQFLSMPGVGYSREKQEKFQKLIKLSAIYQENNNEHQVVMVRLSHDALELMRKKILRMSRKGEDINSMRQIYDLWVESNEKVYGDYALTKKSSELNGRLLNSQMAFKKLNQEMNEDILLAMNMPTIQSMNELERRHYELRKQVKVMAAELKKLNKIINEQNTVTETKSVSKVRKKAKKKSVNSTSKVTRKKISRKKATKKKVTKKKAKRKSSAVKNDVIEIKF